MSPAYSSRSRNVQHPPCAAPRHAPGGADACTRVPFGVQNPAPMTAGQPTARKPMTLTKKILAHHASGLTRPWVQAGDILQIRVDWTIASELAWNGMDKTYTALGRPKVFDQARFFLAVDHTVDPTTLVRDPKAKKLTELSRKFATESGIKHFYDANETILHTK